MQAGQGFKNGKGWLVTLVILAGLDIVFGLLSLLMGLYAGWPAYRPLNPATQLALGTAFATLALQLVLRSISLPVMMRWTWRLVTNIHRQMNFPVSPLWSWLGYVTPIAAFWLPANTLQQLNRKAGHSMQPRQSLIWLWWIMRYLTTPSGVMITFLATFLVGGGQDSQEAIERNNVIGNIALMLIGTSGVIARSLEIVVVIMTHRRQPKSHTDAATVF